jgi:hypothetical protein
MTAVMGACCPVGTGRPRSGQCQGNVVVYRRLSPVLSREATTQVQKHLRPTVADTDTVYAPLLHASTNLFSSQTPSHASSLLNTLAPSTLPKNTTKPAMHSTTMDPVLYTAPKRPGEGQPGDGGRK